MPAPLVTLQEWVRDGGRDPVPAALSTVSAAGVPTSRMVSIRIAWNAEDGAWTRLAP